MKPLKMIGCFLIMLIATVLLSAVLMAVLFVAEGYSFWTGIGVIFVVGTLNSLCFAAYVLSKE